MVSWTVSIVNNYQFAKSDRIILTKKIHSKKYPSEKIVFIFYSIQKKIIQKTGIWENGIRNFVSPKL